MKDFDTVTGTLMYYTSAGSAVKPVQIQQVGEDLQFLLEMYCRGSVYMTVKWVLTGMKDSPAKMSKKLVEAMPPRLAAVFDELKLL